MATSPVDFALFCFGNRARGDDALGEHLHDFLRDWLTRHPAWQSRLRLVCDFQLEPEHIFDLHDARCGIFIDAHHPPDSGVQWRPVSTGTQLSLSSHHLPPESLLFLYENTFAKPAPPCFLLSMGGESFELEEALSPTAQRNLHSAQQLILKKITRIE